MKKRILCFLLIFCMLSGFAALPASCASVDKAETRKYVLELPYDLSKLLSALLEQLRAAAGTRPAGGEHSEAQKPIDTGTPEKTPDVHGGGPTAVDTVSAYEKEVVRLVNAERAKAGLKALTYSEALSNGAREKSADMRNNRYFSHTSPTYGSPFDQMKARGITYRAAGENIAMGYRSPEAVVNAWMNSPGHRANILSVKFTEIGVGYVADGNYWTQWFRG